MTDSFNPVLLVMIVALIVMMLLALRAGRQRQGADHAARYMASPRAVRRLAKDGAKKAKRFGLDTPGLLVGRSVRGGRPIAQDWEACSTDIAGPRTGKSTARAIPAILDAPGPVLATSNKRDVLDVTRGPRSTVGLVWCFDPQRVADEDPSWWWNPLRGVTDEVKAAELADIFAAAVTSPDARTDAHFDGLGRRTVAALLLAAAGAGRTIEAVHEWLTNLDDAEDAAEILRAHGYERLAASLTSVLRDPAVKHRASVIASAERFVTFLTHRETVTWITPGGNRPEFDPSEFVAGSGTLYMLSREGAGSAGAIVAALTAAVTDAAERLAIRSPNGRLALPLVCVLDEAANVVRLPTLPDLYSHYGSRGIALMTFLQSWSQGAEAWGQGGMRKLWSASTVKVYGGGVAEADFLEDLSRLIGDCDRPVVSRTSGRGGTSTNRALLRGRILPVDQLASLQAGRAVVLAAGMPAALVKTTPWQKGPHRREVRAHLDGQA